MVQATYGHTEGTAGITGLLLAAKALQHKAFPPVQNLRNLNPYVDAALTDWNQQHGHSAAISRQIMPASAFTVALFILSAQKHVFLSYNSKDGMAQTINPRMQQF